MTRSSNLTIRNRPPDGISTRAINTVPQSWNDDARSVRVTAATEQPVKVWDWDRYEVVDEILLMDGMVLPANGQVPLLDSHNRHSVEAVLGSARDFAVKGAIAEATVIFSATAEGERAATKVKEGHLTDLSVGYRSEDSVWVPQGEKAIIANREFTGPVKVTRRWSLKELSLTPIGADEQAKTRAEKPPEGRTPTQKETMKMNEHLKRLLISRGLAESATDAEALAFLQRFGAEEQDKLRAEAGLTSQRSEPAVPVVPAAPAVSAPPASRSAGNVIDLDAERKAARQDERARMTGIREACTIVGCPDLADVYINRDLSIDQARGELFTHLGKQKGSQPVGVRLEPGDDERDKFRSAAIDGLAMRGSVRIEKPAEGAVEFRGQRLLRIAEECMRRAGIETRRMRDSELARRSLMVGSTSDFPNILANVASRVLRASYEEYPSTYEAWCAIGDAVNFKDMDRLQLSEAPDLDLIGPNGEYKEGAFGESKESYRVLKYGKKFSISWEAIVNDDLGALTRIPRLFGSSGRRKINDTVYAILTANPNMADGKALFHADHHNLEATVKTVPSVASLDAGRTAMRVQKAIGGKQTLNIAPRFIIVPAALETTTEVILRSAAYPDLANGKASSGVSNPFANRLEPVVEARLDAASAKAWYMAADSRQIDTIEVAFLDGQREPYLEERDGFDVDGREYKVRLVFGAKAIDWRGLLKNPGE